MRTIVIDHQFCGPPTSGNGGYTAGRLAQAAGLSADHPVRVVLRTPPPLDRPLAVRPQIDGAGAQLVDGDLLVADAQSVDADVPTVAKVSLAEAETVSRAYPGFLRHPFPTCLVCGPESPEGMRLFPGRPAPGRTAAVWTVRPEHVGPEFVWAALDCPGGWTSDLEGRPMVLGTMTAVVRALPADGDSCVVVGELLKEEGRKVDTATTAYGPTGQILGQARATWIALREQPRT